MKENQALDIGCLNVVNLNVVCYLLSVILVQTNRKAELQ